VKAKRSATKSSPIAVPANPPPTIYAPRAESGPRWKTRRQSAAACFLLRANPALDKQEGRVLCAAFILS
jgi:hypothetical protein